MKKTILTILTILLANFAYSQNPKQIDKIFEFKLGMTIQELKQIVDTSLLNEVGIEEHEPFVAITLDSNLSGKLKVYYLKRYEISSYYNLEKIYFFLFDNRVFEIQITQFNKKTEDLLSEKYGKPKIDRDDFSLWKLWGTNSQNSATTILSRGSRTGLDEYKLILVDVVTSSLIGELALDEFTKNIIKEEEDMKDRL